MNRFGFRILNHTGSDVALLRGGHRTPIPAHGSVECEFPVWYGPLEAFDQLGDLTLQLAASICAESRQSDFDIEPTEQGYQLHCHGRGAFGVEVVDDDPPRFHFANGEALTTDGPLAAGSF